MAESWRRLSGKKKSEIQPHDLLMLKHELCEMQYLLFHNGSTYSEAHEYDQSKYNYAIESDNYYRRILRS